MNLLVVSEKHGLLILGVSHELWVYLFDPVTFTILSPKPTRIQLDNSEVSLSIADLLSKKSIT